MPKYKVNVKKYIEEADFVVEASDYNAAETQIIMSLAERKIELDEFETPRYKVTSKLHVKITDDFGLSDEEE